MYLFSAYVGMAIHLHHIMHREQIARPNVVILGTHAGPQRSLPSNSSQIVNVFHLSFKVKLSDIPCFCHGSKTNCRTSILVTNLHIDKQRDL